MVDDIKWLIANEIPHLRRYALILTQDRTAADDLVQDTLERAMRKRRLWSRRGSIRSWLYRILFNVFANQGASRRRRRAEVTLDDAPRLSVGPRQESLAACRDIAEAMARLPAGQRAAIALTAIEGFTYDEAAEALGVPIGTLRSRLSRGRDALRAMVDAEPDEAGASGDDRPDAAPQSDAPKLRSVT